MKFEYSRGTITRNVKGHLQAWTYSKGSWLNEALRVDGATLMLTDEPVGCQVKAKINYALLRKPFLANQYSWVVATSNGWVEKQILVKLSKVSPCESSHRGSRDHGRLRSVPQEGIDGSE